MAPSCVAQRPTQATDADLVLVVDIGDRRLQRLHRVRELGEHVLLVDLRAEA
jgi:hypothetical protein